MTSVITLQYAKYHGYDYLYVQNNLTHFETIVREKYNIKYAVPITTVAKDVPTAFHVGLKQFRAASWAKLPPLWYITKVMGHKYKYIFYIDSDATISPLHINQPIEQTIIEWEKQHHISVGNPKPTSSAFIFFNNHPWRDDMPCAGAFIFQPKLAESIFREWWDYDLPSKNFKHFHEQDALWHMIESEHDPIWSATLNAIQYPNKTPHLSIPFKMNSSHYSIVNEHQFPSAWQRYEDLWLCHIASYNYALRVPILRHFLHLLGIRDTTTFSEAVSRLTADHMYIISDPLSITEDMEKASQSDKYRIIRFPIHDEKTQSVWYDKHVSSSQQNTLPLPVLYNDRLIRRRGEYWLVHNQTRWSFTNYDIFLSLGFYKESAFILSSNEVDQIPLGSGMISQQTQETFRSSIDKIVGMINLTPAMDKASKKLCINEDSFIQSLLYSSTNSSIIMYLIAHDGKSEQIAKNFITQQFQCEEKLSTVWMETIRIHSTIYFESWIYHNQSLLMTQYESWKTKRFVITGTYKTVSAKEKAHIQDRQSVEKIKNLLKEAVNFNYDVVPFLRSGSGLMSFATYWHKKSFRIAWDGLLTAMGYSINTIRSLDEIRPFYRNVFIIRPAILIGLIKFMNKAMDISLNDQSVNKLLQQNSHYLEGSTEVAMRIFGTSYYQLFPFIFERLPSFYLHVTNASICSYPQNGPCQYNT